jgi:RNA polymerase sigma-70 factor, ECF subfamily
MEERGIDLVERWRQGDDEAADLLFSRYFERMMRVIGHQLAPSVGARVDPEDVAQSVFRTVFRRMQQGEFKFRNDSDLWKLLVTITLNKARSTNVRHRAARRDVTREQHLGELPLDEGLMQRLQDQPSISAVIAFKETLALVLGKLTDDERTMIELRLEGYSQEEIASKLGMSSRNVRRKMDVIRGKVADLLQPPEENQ